MKIWKLKIGKLGIEIREIKSVIEHSEIEVTLKLYIPYLLGFEICFILKVFEVYINALNVYLLFGGLIQRYTDYYKWGIEEFSKA